MYRTCVAIVAVSRRKGRGDVGTIDPVRRGGRFQWAMFPLN
jgi:hypothetical protein